MKYCSGCHKNLSLDKFGKDKSQHNGYRSRCKDCRNSYRRKHRKENRQKYLKKERTPEYIERMRNSAFKRQYGITVEDYRVLFKKQKGKCKICNKPENHKTKKKLTVDHCHSTKKVRGLLCHSCNCALGLLNDNIKLLKNSIKYLKEN